MDTRIVTRRVKITIRMLIRLVRIIGRAIRVVRIVTRIARKEAIGWQNVLPGWSE